MIGPEGAIYFGQGTATNSGVVGEDNAEFGWLKRARKVHDIPCRDVKLAGVDFESGNPLGGADTARTGAFVPFGTPTKAGQLIEGKVPCSGAILYVADNGYDDRGSRPVWGAADVLWAITPGTWYGWPDFSAGRPLTDAHFDPPGQASLAFVLAEHPNRPPAPAAVLGVHSSSNGFDFARNPAFGHVGQAFVAQFGDQAPMTGKVLGPVGFKVVRVDPETGEIEDFMVNRGDANGPASRLGTHGLERPVAARFDRTGEALYVVDFGVMQMTDQGPVPRAGTGVLWRIRKGA